MVAAEHGEPRAAGTRGGSRWSRWIVRPVLFFLAVVATSSGPLAVVLLGFVQRDMERRAIRAWLRRGTPVGVSAASVERSANDLCADAALARWRRGIALLRRGSVAFVASSVLLFPALTSWAFGWWGGWNNSFAKGYEQAAVGPGVSLLGVAWFCVAMPYVVMALARFAVVDRWQLFFDFGVNVRIAVARWWTAGALALAFGTVGLVVFLLRTVPGYFPQLGWFAEAQTLPEVRAALGFWYLLAGFVFVPLYFGIKRISASIYANSLVLGLERGLIDWHTISDREQALLRSCGSVDCATAAVASKTGEVGAVRRGGTAAWIWLPAAVLWLLLVAQTYVGQFLNYHGPSGWLISPLVTLPVLRTTPPHLTSETAE